MDIEECLSELQNLEGFKCGLPASDDDIARVESSLGVVLPHELRSLISKLGFVSWLGGEICGISEDSFFDIVKKTLDARSHELPDEFEPMPDETVVLTRYGGGGYFLIFSEENERSGEVILILDETFYEEDESWSSLSSFLEDMHLT